jgi:hypothetical protein
MIKANSPRGEKNGLRNLGNNPPFFVSSVWRDLNTILSLFPD